MPLPVPCEWPRYDIDGNPIEPEVPYEAIAEHSEIIRGVATRVLDVVRRWPPGESVTKPRPPEPTEPRIIEDEPTT